MNTLNEIQVSYRRNPEIKTKIVTSTDAVAYLRPLFVEMDLRESFYAIYLNRQNHVIGHYLIFYRWYMWYSRGCQINFRHSPQMFGLINYSFT